MPTSFLPATSTPRTRKLKAPPGTSTMSWGTAEATSVEGSGTICWGDDTRGIFKVAQLSRRGLVHLGEQVFSEADLGFPTARTAPKPCGSMSNRRVTESE